MELENKACDLIHHVWKSINWENIAPSRRIGIYDEFTSKVKSASCNSSLSIFCERLSNKMGIRCIKNSQNILDILKENNQEILRLLREETQLIVLLMRERIDTAKEEREVRNEKI